MGGGDQGRAPRRGATFTRHDGLPCGGVPVTRPPAAILEYLPSNRRLTKREWEVLSCIAEGYTNRRVAAQLSISMETVRTHVSNILAKLETPNRSAAAAKYHQLRSAQ